MKHPLALLWLVALLPLSLLGGCDRFVSAESRLQRAREAVASGDHRTAVVELMNAIAKQPDNDAAHFMLAESALWLGDGAGAQRELTRVKRADAARRAELELRIALALGEPDQVLNAPAAATAPLAPGVREMYRGFALLQLRRAAEARAEFAAAVAADEALLAARAGALEAQAAQGERAAALVGLAALTEQHPDSAAAWLTFGMTLAQGGDTPGAIRALQRAQELAPRQIEVVRQASLLAALTEAQLLERQLDAARKTSEALNRLAPGSPIALFVSSRLAMAGNDPATAVTQLRKVVRQAPDLPQARYQLAMALAAQGSLEQASAELNDLLQRLPDHVGARQLLAQLYLRRNDPDGALRMLVPALDSAGDDAQVNLLFDAARGQLGVTQSVALLEQALAQQPHNEGLQTQLAMAYLQADAAAKALPLLGAPRDGEDLRRTALRLAAVAATEGAAAARGRLAALVAAHPDDPQLANLAATYYARGGDTEAARRTLNRALARAPHDDLLLTLARVEWSAGARAAAAAALEKLLQRSPGNAAGLMAAGEIALATGELDQARAQFEKARAARPDSPEIGLRLAQLAFAQNDAKRGAALIDELVERAPDNPALRSAAGALNLSYGRPDQALEQFRAAVAVQQRDPALWFNLGRAQRAVGQSGAARESLQRALALRPNWMPAVGGLVALDIEAQDSAAALARVAAFRKALPADSPAAAQADALMLEGEVQAAAQRHADASNAYAAAFALSPAAATAARDYRARLTGNLPRPEALLTRWVAAHPEDVASRSLLADAHMRSGDRARATEQYRVILQARPTDVVALNNLAWLYYESKDARALPLAREAVRLAPQSAAVKDTLGWLLVENGQAAEGIVYLKSVLEQQGSNGDIRFHYAAALAQTGAADEARRRLAELLRDPAPFASRAQAQSLHDSLAVAATGTR